MSRARLPRVMLILCFLLGAGVVPDAAAQLGKLKKAIAGKAADEGQNAACIPSRPPTYVETVNLTSAQMMKINAGLDAEAQTAPVAYQEQEQQQKNYEQEQKAYEKEKAAYDKANEKYQACAEKVEAANAARSEELSQKREAATEATKDQIDQDKMTKLAERAQAAADRVSKGQGTAEDRATLAEFQQMMAGVQSAGNQAIAASQESREYDEGAAARLKKECGEKPVEPKAPSQASMPGDKIREAGAKAAGLTPFEYATGRDDMIALAMSNTVVKAGKVSQEEADAMNQAIKDAGKRLCALRKAGAPI